MLTFEDVNVRVIGRNMVAKDVIACLGLDKVSDAMNSVDDEDKQKETIQTPGGTQEMWTVNESGMYSLIFRSRKPQAKRFKKWVTSVVLPALHATGSFDMQLKERDPKALLIQRAHVLLKQRMGKKAYNAYFRK